MTAQTGSFYERRRGSTGLAALIMLGLSILLIWLPLLGPFIAGFVGGRVAVTAGKAFLASILPAIILAVAVGVILTAFHLPIIGAVAGVAAFLLTAVHVLPVVIGALLGAALTK